jgi:glycosyltransferase involved in cell wall biosynthesis
MTDNKEQNYMKLGYYLQIPYYPTPNGPRVEVEVADWSRHFMDYCDRFVCLLHSSDVYKWNYELAEGAELGDLGPMPRHWQLTLGHKPSIERLKAYSTGLDAVIIQGPTSFVPHAARAVQPALPVFYLVGFWTQTPSHEFKINSPLKELGLRLMKMYSEWEHRRVFSSGIITGNNPLQGERYGHLAPFTFINHNRLHSHEIVGRDPQSLHDPVRLLSLGRVDPDKYLETVFKAMQKLQSRLNFVLDVVGSGADSYMQHLQDMITQLGLSERVQLHGRVPFEQVGEFFQEADLFIFHTGGTEGFPRVIWEAYARGVPVISAHFPGADLLLTDHQDVLLYPRLGSDELVERILEAIENKTLRHQLAANGLELVRQNTVEISCKQMVETIDQALRERGSYG